MVKTQPPHPSLYQSHNPITKKNMKLINNTILWLTLILILGFVLRLYKIDNPVGDWHSWRQADTAAVARNFFEEGFNPFMPRGDDMSPISEIAISSANLERLRFVEFPVYSSLVYFGYLLNGAVDERIARAVAAIFSVSSAIFLYLIVKKYSSKTHALLSAFVLVTLPFGIYFGRVILPEPSLIFFSLGMFYFIDRWIFEKSKSLMAWSIFFTSLAFLTKPMAIFFLLPLVYSYYLKEGFRFPPLRYFVLAGLSLIPFAAWRFWMLNFPEGIPASSWLLNGNEIRFRPAFFRWIIGDRLGREILSIAGGLLFGLGILIKPLSKPNYLLHLLTLSSFLYLVVFATGNVQHDYYQILLLPALAIFLARGFLLLLSGLPFFLPRIVSIPLAVFLLAVTYYLTWLEIRGLYQINNYSMIKAGRVADEILPKNARVLAQYNGDTAFLYQINRDGFTSIISSAEQMKKDYALDYYLSTARDPRTAWLMNKYEVVVDDPEYVIINFNKLNSSFIDKGETEPM